MTTHPARPLGGTGLHIAQSSVRGSGGGGTSTPRRTMAWACPSAAWERRCRDSRETSSSCPPRSVVSSVRTHGRLRSTPHWRVCEDHGTTLPAAAIAFPLQHPAVAGVVLGMRTVAQVDPNLDRYVEDVPAALWADLQSLGLLASSVR